MKFVLFVIDNFKKINFFFHAEKSKFPLTYLPANGSSILQLEKVSDYLFVVLLQLAVVFIVMVK